MTIQINHFDRGKPFYPLVMSYIIQLLGVKELAVRGLIGPRKVTEEDLLKSPRGWDREKDCESIRSIEKLLGPLELRSEFQRDRVIVDADEMAIEIVDNHLYLLPFYFRGAGSLLILAHEITKHQNYRDNGPLWEFLHHCRNAATHNGLFRFDKGQPRYPAIWSPFTLDTSLEGTPLFKDEKDAPGLFSPGDPIRLLWDIEQSYPDMTV